MDQAPFSIQLLTLDGRTVGVNRAWEELWGVTLDQIADYNILDDPQLAAKGVAAYLRRAFLGETVRIPAISYNPEETLPGRSRHQDAARWVSAIAYPLRDTSGNVREVVLVHEDVTERTRAETALAFLADASRALSESLEYETTLKALTRLGVPDFADWCVVDLLTESGDIRRVAAAHQEPEKEALAWEVVRRWPLDREAPEGVPKVIRTGRPELYTDIEDTLLVAVGRHREYIDILRGSGLKSAMIFPLVARGRTLGAISFAYAESGRRYREHDVAPAEELARRAAIAIDNARLYSEVQQATRDKDEFLAMLAHELRNPLGPILNAVNVLDQIGEENPNAARFRAVITRQTRHLARLVDDLLDVSRIASGKVHLELEVVDVRDVITRSVAGLHEGGRVREHEIIVSLPPDPVVVHADPVRLEQVVGNLLDNAVKFTPPGGAVRAIASRDGTAAVLRVQDEGVGIEPGLLSRIFEPFVQAEPPVGRPQRGLGLGLSLVRKLVEQQGGTVAAHSAGAGRGSEFVVRLPLASPGAHPPRRSARPEARQPLDVLLIDDNDDALLALRTLLEIAGHRVEAAADGEHGLTIAARTRPQVVLVDIDLPRMDGYEVARRLRASAPTRSARLIALTGHGQPEDRRRSEAAGFDAHLVKPVDADQLARVLDSSPGPRP